MVDYGDKEPKTKMIQIPDKLKAELKGLLELKQRNLNSFGFHAQKHFALLLEIEDAKEKAKEHFVLMKNAQHALNVKMTIFLEAKGVDVALWEYDYDQDTGVVSLEEKKKE